MRGALFIVMLIALLVVGVLVVKNMSTETTEGVEKMETIQKARDTAGEAEKQAAEMGKRLKEATQSLPPTD
ncbi:MAG: hypothetical protein SWC96_10080 [Thermodesulfobacteriota bacterium]|nr:hypothetical protein [Thermodesulfobacteriota bacterium]